MSRQKEVEKSHSGYQSRTQYEHQETSQNLRGCQTESMTFLHIGVKGHSKAMEGGRVRQREKEVWVEGGRGRMGKHS